MPVYHYRFILSVITVASCTLSWSESVFADASTQFTVSATVADNCDVSADDLNFGTYNPLSATPLTGNTTVHVTCTTGTSYTVGLTAGLGSGATVTTRRMTRTVGGSETLDYSLYQESSYTTVWGDTPGTDTIADTGDGTEQDLPVYGRVTASQNVPVASYNDTITVNVRF